MNRKKIAIFGAGERGRYLFDIFSVWGIICFYADNDVNKIGTSLRGIPIISTEQMIQRKKKEKFDVVISTDKEDFIQDIILDMKKNNIDYWLSCGNEKNYFDCTDVIKEIDAYWYDQFKNNKRMLGGFFPEKRDNWFRKVFWNSENEKIVKEMQNSDRLDLEHLYNERYSKADFDATSTLFERRVGIRLVFRRIMERENVVSICDLGCGQGALVQRLKKEMGDSVNICALDSSAFCIEKLKRLGIDARCENLEMNTFSDEMFDIVCCMEVLEHVKNVINAVSEIRRITKRGGTVYITVPYGSYCDCAYHVRHFTENSLASCFLQQSFRIVNVMRIPKMNDGLGEHILLEAEKR